MHTCLSVYMCIICMQEPVIITRGTEFPRNGVKRDIELPGGGTWVLRKSSKCSWPLCSRPWTCLSVYVFIQLWVDLLLPRRVPQLLKQGEPLEGLCAISHVFSSVWSCSLPTTSATHLHPMDVPASVKCWVTVVGISLQANTLNAFHLHAAHIVLLRNVCPGPLVIVWLW